MIKQLLICKPTNYIQQLDLKRFLVHWNLRRLLHLISKPDQFKIRRDQHFQGLINSKPKLITKPWSIQNQEVGNCILLQSLINSNFAGNLTDQFKNQERTCIPKLILNIKCQIPIQISRNRGKKTQKLIQQSINHAILKVPILFRSVNNRTRKHIHIHRAIDFKGRRQKKNLQRSERD